MQESGIDTVCNHETYTAITCIVYMSYVSSFGKQCFAFDALECENPAIAEHSKGIVWSFPKVGVKENRDTVDCSMIWRIYSRSWPYKVCKVEGHMRR